MLISTMSFARACIVGQMTMSERAQGLQPDALTWSREETRTPVPSPAAISQSCCTLRSSTRSSSEAAAAPAAACGTAYCTPLATIACAGSSLHTFRTQTVLKPQILALHLTLQGTRNVLAATHITMACMAAAAAAVAAEETL